MKKRTILKKSLALLLVILLSFATMAFAFAEEPGSALTDDRPVVEQTTQSATTPNSTAVDGSGTVTVDNGTTVISDGEVPLSKKPYELGWALFNLLATVFTAVIAVALAFFIVRNRSKGPDNNFGLSVFSCIAAILSVVLFAGTEDLSMSMIVVDSYSVAHASVLAVAILCAALSLKKGVRSTISR